MGVFGSIGHFFGASSKGKDLSAEDRVKEETAQAALDKLVTGPKAFGNRTMSAADAEAQLRAQGALPAGWRLRESDSTSSGYRPTSAASKKMAALHAGQVGAAAFTGGASLAGMGVGVATNAAIQGGLGAAQGALQGGGLKGALIGGGLGAATGGYVPGGAGTAGLVKNMAVQGGLGALRGAATGGGVKGTLLGAGMGAAGAAAGRVAPAVTSNPLGQQAVNVGVNTGLDTARTGSFNPTSTALNAAGSFLPTAARGATDNPLGQRLLAYGGNQAMNAMTGRFSPLTAGVDAARTLAPRPKNVYNSYLGG